MILDPISLIIGFVSGGLVMFIVLAMFNAGRG